MKETEFTSSMNLREYIAALLWLPLHLLVLPLLMKAPMEAGKLSEAAANLIRYAVGAAYMLVFLYGFLRRDFDPLCDRPGFTILQIGGSYIAMLFFNSAIGILIYLITGELNPNNAQVISLAGENRAYVTVMAVFLAPLAEECAFRGAIFGKVRKKNRVLAYTVSILLFSLYHVYGYANENPAYLLYAVQYFPVSFLLCRCYEQTNTIWTPVFLHMLVNAASLKLAEAALQL